MHARGILRQAALATLVVVTAAVWPVAGQGRAQSEAGIPSDRKPKALEGVTYAQRLGEQVPPDLAFVDETGKAVRLGDYFGKRPMRARAGVLRVPDALHAGACLA